MPNQTVKNGVKVKKIKLPQLNFHVPISLSHSTKLKEILEPIQSYEDVPFLGPKWPICPEQFFFCTNHYYYFNLPIGSFHCAKFKKILTADPEL